MQGQGSTHCHTGGCERPCPPGASSSVPREGRSGDKRSTQGPAIISPLAFLAHRDLSFAVFWFIPAECRPFRRRTATIDLRPFPLLSDTVSDGWPTGGHLCASTAKGGHPGRQVLAQITGILCLTGRCHVPLRSDGSGCLSLAFQEGRFPRTSPLRMRTPGRSGPRVGQACRRGRKKSIWATARFPGDSGRSPAYIPSGLFIRRAAC